MPDTPPNFNDESSWEIIPDVTVFDEHEERNSKGELQRAFRRVDLDAIATNNNDRDSKGDFCPLTIGHTKDGAKETDQPPIVGYARKFSVVYDDVRKRHVIKCHYYLKKEHAEEAKKYPRTSVELWAKDKFFDPIALLIRTPQRDLGQWTYAQGGKKIRYSMADATGEVSDKKQRRVDKMAKFTNKFKKLYAKQPTNPKKLKKYARKLAKFAKKYAGKKYDATGPAMASGTDTFTPSSASSPVATTASDPGQAKFSKDKDMKPSEEQRIRDDQARIEKAQYEKRIEELEAKDKARDAEAIRYRREADLKQLVYEGFRLDVADELGLCEGMTDEQFTKHKERIRNHYMKDPPKQLIRLAGGEFGDQPNADKDANRTTADQHGRAMKLAEQLVADKKATPQNAYDTALKMIKEESKAKTA